MKEEMKEENERVKNRGIEGGRDDQLMIFLSLRLVVYQMKRSHFLW